MGVQGMKDPFRPGLYALGAPGSGFTALVSAAGPNAWALRKKALAEGTFVPVQGDLGGVCYERQSDGARLLAAVNRTSEPKTFAVDPVWDNAYAFLTIPAWTAD